MATAKKKTEKKKSPSKTKASPVGRPPNLVKLTAKDVPSGVADLVNTLAHNMGVDAETVVTLALLHMQQQPRGSGARRRCWARWRGCGRGRARRWRARGGRSCTTG